jgi:uncharacterized protein YwgA
MNSRQQGWAAAATKSLADAGSWTGRIHSHKHLFVTQILRFAEVPFDFELYHYGPYAFDLDRTISLMEGAGEIASEFRKPGYGPSYCVTAFGDDAVQVLDPDEVAVAEHVAKLLAKFDSSELELIATCLWVIIREGETDQAAIVSRVKEIKPKYTSVQIDWARQKAVALRESAKIL